MFVDMSGHTRHKLILERLHIAGRVDVAELAVELDTSEVTIRRDLDVLAEQGTLRRIRGGAVSLLMSGEELPFAMREVDSTAEKQRIAAATAELIRDGEAIVVDSGTTGLAVARALVDRRLTAMPLSLHSAVVFAASSSVHLLLPGGETRFGEGSMVGPIAESSVRALRFDTVVLTCCGLSPDDGVTAHDLQDAAVKRAAIASARRTILVAESAKFARTALAIVCDPDAVDILVTDDGAPDEALRRFRAAGVDVHRV